MSNMETENILVVIPYLASGAQGRELEFAITGWRRHFKQKHIIVLVGESLPMPKDTPYLRDNAVICVESKRVDDIPNQYRQHIDYVSCFKRVHSLFPNSTGFIFVADDCYAVNDFTLADVKRIKFMPGGVDFDPNSENAWRRDKAKTKHLLESMGYPHRNFTTHLPIWFDWDKIEVLWQQYGMDKESYVIEDLYYNLYYPLAGGVEIGEDDPYKCGVHSANPSVLRLKRGLSEKVWITNSPNGYTILLEKMLVDEYGL